ncbi:MAG: sulfur carrier protein ThiS [Fibrobacteres bacterium]|nr:sulfur carrier protein ThiS [Fibrobacterota bacterium]
MEIEITVNGKKRMVGQGLSISNLLSSFNIVQTHVVVEINECAIDRDKYNSTTLNSGDTVEILQFVGGG